MNINFSTILVRKILTLNVDVDDLYSFVNTSDNSLLDNWQYTSNQMCPFVFATTLNFTLYLN